MTHTPTNMLRAVAGIAFMLLLAVPMASATVELQTATINCPGGGSISASHVSTSCLDAVPVPLLLPCITKLGTALCTYGFTEVLCIYTTAPANWLTACSALPPTGYPFCYYNTPPSNWANCV
jgi:hypothetical protein